MIVSPENRRELADLSRTNIGRRVRVTGVLPDEPNPLKVGEEGTIAHVDDAGTLHVKWDSGRTLGLLLGDPWEMLPA